MKLAFVLLAHGDPALAERLIGLLTMQGHVVAVHYDAKSPRASYERLCAAFRGNDAVRFARRASVGWAQWGVVQGALNCLHEIENAGWNPDYVYQISGMDYPIRSSAELVSFLQRNIGDEFIESVPADDVSWVKTGPQQERYQYYWWFNWRRQPKITEFIFDTQKKLQVKRGFVRGIKPYIGSQWWVLTWKTLQKVMALASERDIIAFFKTTLVPDELFFQTLVRHVAPEAPITNCSLTLYQFSDYGYPVVYYADHVDDLVRRPFFMARKISPHDKTIRDRLDAYWLGQETAPMLHDRSVGIVGPEYENHRLTYRNGAPGVPVIGLTPSTEVVDRVAKPFFVVVGASNEELRTVQVVLDDLPELLCHGRLFHPKRIEFACQRRDFAGYDTESVEIRDAGSDNFLADVLRAEKSRMSGFLINMADESRVSDWIFSLPNMRLVMVYRNPTPQEMELGSEPVARTTYAVPVLAQLRHLKRWNTAFETLVTPPCDQAENGPRFGLSGSLLMLDLSAGPERCRDLLKRFLGVHWANLNMIGEETPTGFDSIARLTTNA